MGHTVEGPLSETTKIWTFRPLWVNLWIPRVLETLDFFYCIDMAAKYEVNKVIG